MVVPRLKQRAFYLQGPSLPSDKVNKSGGVHVGWGTQPQDTWETVKEYLGWNTAPPQ